MQYPRRLAFGGNPALSCGIDEQYVERKKLTLVANLLGEQTGIDAPQCGNAFLLQPVAQR